MRLVALGMAAILAGWAMPAAAQKEEPVRGFEGACASDSEVAGSPYSCNAMILVRIAPDGPQALLIFATRGDDGSTMRSVGGSFDASGALVVDGIQLKAGDRTPFTGSCTSKRSGRETKAVRCAATEDGGSGRTVTIEFKVSHEIKT